MMTTGRWVILAVVVALLALTFSLYCTHIRSGRERRSAALPGTTDDLSASLSWEKPTDLGEAGGELYYRLDAKAYVGNATKSSKAFTMKIPGTETSIKLDDKLDPGFTWKLSLQACNAAGCSEAITVSLSTQRPTITSTVFSPDTLATKNTPFSIVASTDHPLMADSSLSPQLSGQLYLSPGGKTLTPITVSCKPLHEHSRKFSLDFAKLPEAD